jgi:hypothetical protein
MERMETFKTCPGLHGGENDFMKEVIFEVVEEVDGGYAANALGYGIHTQGDSLEELRERVREAVLCFFEETDERPSLIRLHFVRDEVLTL